MRFFYLFIFLCLSTILRGQNITISEEPIITNMMERFVAINKSVQYISGWRIQLLATTDRRKMEKEKADFMRLYPNISIDWFHSAPYYKLRAGAFSKKLDADRMIFTLKNDFPGCYITKDSHIPISEIY